ncbi:hypothetical protein IFT84_13710 [Rhizobium sp. CFBP 8762]|uniref:glycine-rich domain-containing protein n=1 Tax=Rhizobium sp. CFBP 8762 TaxID=2775279 RepID=UPI00177BB732|nr:hypothetical protein [Rhizobium sp. CFBP 8762]MBD8555564.1 hypothetical protein [Rhizobium sp. CFBP 8762]
MKYYPPFGSTDPDAHYVDRNTAGAQRGSAIPAKMPEMVQREIVAVISGSGIDPADDLQLPAAVQSQKMNYTVAAGSTNALTVALTPALESYQDGVLIRMKVRITNTGPATLRVGTLATLPIVRADGSPLQRSDLIADQVVDLICTGTAFQVSGLKTIDLPSRNLWSKTTAGVGSFVVPVGVFKIFARVVGGGGGAAGVGQYADGSAKCSGGGGAGGYAEKWIDVVPGQTVSAVVGAGGVGGAASPNNVNNNGSPGQNGGSTTLTANGTIISATGGEQGSGATTVAGGYGGIGSGGDLNFAGGFGTDGAPVNGVYGGNGGAGAFGGGGRSGTNGGINGVSPGSGGGAHYGYWAANGKGGNGADGAVIIQY